ncbi:glycogen debranching protein GlgX [bacterium]|nr:glycogen debranching protein GlgX [bacterium]
MTSKPAPATSRGEPYPLGATVLPGGVNFSLFSLRASNVELLLFNHFADLQPDRVFILHPQINKTFYYWHIFVEGIGGGQIYAYRVYGPFDPAQGHRFNSKKVLIDPYSKGVVYGKNWSREQACSPEENCGFALKSLTVNSDLYDWESVPSPRHSLSDVIIYEMHVRGFTRHPSARVQYPGTFDGVVEKIPYLKELGITTVELLPVQQFDATENPYVHPGTGEKLNNYWGYNPIGFFAPHRGYYIADWEQMEYLTGFRDMVKTLHKAGLEVILDVVFNHTGEGDENGPTISLKGLENSTYYLLENHDKSKYANYSGCGNTVSCNHPVIRRLILDCLRYWVNVMHVDGFRFDLASVLARDEKGRPMENPPLLWEIESDPVLQKTKIIAEAWDAAGLYQVGSFPGERWAEWNGRYRDDVRRFVRGDNGTIESFASRILGSPDLYHQYGRNPHQSINYITCHDGFTLNDLVSYNHKHNLENGEENRDGQNENYSSNYGVEGPGTPELEAFRRKQIKNFLAILFLSQGTPMILMGDEVRRSQRGNNNAYCQDNEISWFDWTLLEKQRDLLRFCKEMIRFRKSHPALRSFDYFFGQKNEYGWPEITWHGIKLNHPDWGFHSHSIAFTLAGFQGAPDLHAMINCYWEDLQFELPLLPAQKQWLQSVDTSLPSPNDIADNGKEIPVQSGHYLVSANSVAIFVSA